MLYFLEKSVYPSFYVYFFKVIKMIIEEECNEYEESGEEIIDEEEVDYEEDIGIVFEKERGQTKLLKYLSKRIQRSSLIT